MAEAKVCYLHPQALPNLKESGSVSKFDAWLCMRQTACEEIGKQLPIQVA